MERARMNAMRPLRDTSFYGSSRLSSIANRSAPEARRTLEAHVSRKEAEMIYFMALAFAVGLGVPIAVLGAGLGQGRAAASAMEAMARQPELLPKLQTAMILALVIESLVILSLLVFLLLNGKIPDTAEVLKAIAAGGK